jgi:rubrerythrin
MECLLDEAVRVAILTEKRRHEMYRKMARLAGDDHARNLFGRLAEEEASHLAAFLEVYPGNRCKLNNALLKQVTLAGEHYQSQAEGNDAPGLKQDALQLLIREAQACIDLYAPFVSCLKEKRLCALFQRALEYTNRHVEAMKEEYHRITGQNAIPGIMTEPSATDALSPPWGGTSER